MSVLILVSIVLFLIGFLLYAGKRDRVSPAFFWCAIWGVSTLFAGLNPFDMMKISDKALLTMSLGIFAFLLGCIRLRRVSFRIDGHSPANRNSFRRGFCYFILALTLAFNAVMTATAAAMLARGVPYARLRDVFFGYGSYASQSFFSSSFLQTGFSWIIQPATSLLMVILAINLKKKQLPRWFDILCLIDIAMYVAATVGRLLIMHLVVSLYFVYAYYRVSISRKSKKRIRIAMIAVVALLLVMTFYRSRGSSSVPTTYSYFCINFPLFSHWMEYADANHALYYGSGFFKGILEGVNYLLGKFGAATPLYWDMQEIFNQIQSSWVQVFPRNWYNAYVSCFYYFYLDFGVAGVILGSFVFGKGATAVYRTMKKRDDLLSTVLYLIVLQVVVDAFIRWQLGTFTYVMEFLLAFLCVKKTKKRKKGKAAAKR